MKKWVYPMGKFEKHSVPWHCTLVSFDHPDTIQCANCGKEVVFTNSYMSHAIQPDEQNYGDSPSFAICPDCAKEEMKGEKKWMYHSM